MKRADCIKALYPELHDRLVVTIMGACAQELYDLGHCDNFFYLEHAMGLASSIGLGLAMNLPDEKVVVLDGDGSVLMNLGGLATLARYRPPNLTHIIFDNGSLLSTGGFASHTTSGIVDLAAIARGAGCPRVSFVTEIYQFLEAAADAFESSELTTIVAKVEAVGPDHYGMDLKLPENAFRFEHYIEERQRAKQQAAGREVARKQNAVQ
jgi:sulfopyruvate decarboxylase subunit beta